MDDFLACPYCGCLAALITGAQLYPHLPDLAGKWFWRCEPCKAHVGCHPNTKRPLGRLADAELRRNKMRAHAAFDPLWKSRKMRRGEAYAWLAEQLGLTADECHIGMFDVAMCRRVVDVCHAYKMAAVR